MTEAFKPYYVWGPAVWDANDQQLGHLTAQISYVHKNNIFDVLVTDRGHPGMTPSDRRDAVEVRYLRELHGLFRVDYWAADRPPQAAQEEAGLWHELMEMVGDACLTLFQKLSPPPFDERGVSGMTAHELMYPEIRSLQAVTIGGSLRGIQREDLPVDDRYPPVHDEVLRRLAPVISRLPRYRTTEIRIIDQFVGMSYHVSVGSTEMVAYLSIGCDPDAEGLIRECKVLQAGLNEGLRVPKLRGLIESHTGVVGMLTSYPPGGRSLGYWLEEPGGAEISTERRRKYIRQLREILEALHARGIVWGQAVSRAVVIDRDDDVWVADFTPGRPTWPESIDRDVHGTPEGDLQGLRRIKKILGLLLDD